MQVTEATLDALPGFRDLDPATYAEVAAISRLIESPSQAVLCRQGTPPDMLHYLLEGQVALTKAAPNGEIIVIDVLRPVSGIALATAVTGQLHEMTAQALTESRLVQIQAAPLRCLIEERPSLATTMLMGLSLDTSAVTRQVIDLKLRTSAQRLGCYLVRQAACIEGNRAEFRLPVRKGLLAGIIGCRQENLSRAFAALRSFGVETHGRSVILHDVARLRSYALDDLDLPSDGTPDLMQSARAFSNVFNLR